MRITIRSLRDNPFFIEVEEQATIFGVKAAIFQMNGVFPAHQSIIYQGNILSNDTTLPSLNFPANKEPSLYLVISKEQRERLKKEKEEKSKKESDELLDSPPKSDFFSSFANSMGQGFGAQNNSCFDSIMKNITDKSPNFSHALNDKEALYESYDAFRDPGKRLELLKSIDRTLNLVESKAGCYRDIIQHQRLVTEAVDDAIDKYMHEINPTYYENLHKTVIPEKPLEEPSCEPIQMDLTQSDSFMDSLLQHQLMLVMTLPNGAQKLVTIKKNTDAVLKIMRLMMNLQAKSQKKKSKEKTHFGSSNKASNLFFNNDFNSQKFTAFNFDESQNFAKNDNQSENENDDQNENGNESLGLGLENGMKQIEIESQMNLLKILMMSIVSDENSNDDDNDNSKSEKKSSHFEDEYDSGSSESHSLRIWNKLLNDRNPNKNKRNKLEIPKQPKYDQVFHRPNQKSSSPPINPYLVDIDSESDSSTNSDSNFCLNSNYSSPDYQSIQAEDEDSFFDNDFFTNNINNSVPFHDTKSYAKPRFFGQPTTTYYSPTNHSIGKLKTEQNKKNDYPFLYDSNENNDNNNNGEDEIEKKRKQGWEIIYDIVNGSNQNSDIDSKEKDSANFIEENNNDQNGYTNFNNNESDDDSSDISID